MNKTRLWNLKHNNNKITIETMIKVYWENRYVFRVDLKAEIEGANMKR